MTERDRREQAGIRPASLHTFSGLLEKAYKGLFTLFTKDWQSVHSTFVGFVSWVPT